MQDGALIKYLEQEWSMKLTGQLSIDQITEKLAQYVDILISHDFDRLIQLLYKVDVDESKLKELLKNTSEDAGKIIAGLIIQRQLEKAKTRQYFKPEGGEKSDEEKW